MSVRSHITARLLRQRDDATRITSQHLVRVALLLCTLALAATGPRANADRDQVSADAITNLEAYAAYKSGDYDRARAIWSRLAMRGNTTAMNNLANMFDQGQGVDEDPVEAARLLRLAAERGDHVAQLNLGLAYERGRGVPRDNRLAAEWFRRAAVQGDAQAQLNLGVMLATNYGAGIETTSAAQRAEAASWLEQAAGNGEPEAAEYLDLLR